MWSHQPSKCAGNGMAQHKGFGAKAERRLIEMLAGFGDGPIVWANLQGIFQVFFHPIHLELSGWGILYPNSNFRIVPLAWAMNIVAADGDQGLVYD